MSTGGTTLKTPLLEGFFVFRDIKTKRVIKRVTSWGVIFKFILDQALLT
jgi:hypothetical protein